MEAATNAAAPLPKTSGRRGSALIFIEGSKKPAMPDNVYTVETARANDNDVIKSVLEGDTDSFAFLVDRYKDRVFGIVSAHVPEDSVSEVANNVFFKAFKSLPKFKNDSPFVHWLSAITVNTCRDFWRAGYARKDSPMASFEEDFEKSLENRPSGATPEENLLRQERKNRLTEALNVLKPTERTVINMIYSEDRSVAETAELLKMTESNVKVTAFRARKKLAAVLGDLSGG